MLNITNTHHLPRETNNTSSIFLLVWPCAICCSAVILFGIIFFWCIQTLKKTFKETVSTISIYVTPYMSSLDQYYNANTFFSLFSVYICPSQTLPELGCTVSAFFLIRELTATHGFRKKANAIERLVNVFIPGKIHLISSRGLQIWQTL